MAGMTDAARLQGLNNPQNQQAENLNTLHQLCLAGDASNLRAAINSGSFDVSSPDRFGRNCLHFAVISNSKPCVDILLQVGASPSLVDIDGRNPVHWACFHQRIKLIKPLLSKETISVLDQEGRSVLHMAVLSSNPKVVELVLKSFKGDGIDVDVGDKDNLTPLHMATINDSTKIVQLLLNSGSNPETIDIQGNNALHWAITHDKSASMKILLCHSSSKGLAEKKDGSGRYPLHLCVNQNSLELVQLLLKQGKANPDVRDESDRTPTHWAAVTGQIDVLQTLLKFKCDPLLQDNVGATPLHYASQSDHPSCIEILIKHNPDIVTVVDSNQQSALHWALANGCSKSIIELTKTSTILNLVDIDGMTVLSQACAKNQHEIVRILVKAGCDLNCQDLKGITPISICCREGSAESFDHLLQANASLVLADEEGKLPIHYAAISNQPNLVEQLTHSTQDCGLNQGDGRGDTAVHFSAYFGHSAVLQTLLSSGANPNLQNTDGLSPLHWASVQGHSECVQLLLQFGAYPNFTENSENKLTPYDYAVQSENGAIAHQLSSQGGISIAALQIVAAIKLQSWYRRFKARQELQKRQEEAQRIKEHAVISIQSVCRGFLTRRRVQKLMSIQEDERKAELERQAEVARKQELAKKEQEEREAEEKKMQEMNEQKMKEEEKRRKQKEKAERAKREEAEKLERARREADRAAEEAKRQQQQAKENALKEQQRIKDDDDKFIRRRVSVSLSQNVSNSKMVLQRQHTMARTARNERARIKQLRETIAAARVIQRWWRYTQHQKKKSETMVQNPISKRKVSKQSSRTKLESRKSQSIFSLPVHDLETNARRQLVAALTIQLWWRRYLASKHRKQHSTVKKRKASIKQQFSSMKGSVPYGDSIQTAKPYVSKPKQMYHHKGYQGPPTMSVSWQAANKEYTKTQKRTSLPSLTSQRQVQKSEIRRRQSESQIRLPPINL